MSCAVQALVTWPRTQYPLDRRYPIVVDVTYQVLNGDQVVKTGQGRTVDISSRGLSFESEEILPPGKQVKLAVTWPAMLNNRVGLNLHVLARTVPARNGCTAVEILKYEFRTRPSGSPAIQPVPRSA